ncbi:MAG: transposase [Nitrososphaeraceae archaeon]|nr:transposase [Nitrososphaeraceae archaeon]
MLIKNIVYLVKENPPPARPKNKSNRGRKPVHSWEKLVCICILMVVFGSTYRDIQNIIPSINLPWNNNEPYPDHTWISRTFKKIPLIYLESMLLRSAYMCLKESGWKKGMLASDSSGIETDRYEYEVRPVKSKKKFEKIMVKQYLKWHVTAILDHLIILSTRLTTKKTHDSPVLRTMLNRLKKCGVDLAGSILNGDRGYDGNKNFQSVFGMDMLPNIKQRKNAKNKNSSSSSSSKKNKYRKKAAKIFNASIYHYRGLIEGIFGAEETEHHHQMYCRFRLKNNQKRFGLIKALGWNLEVLNRLQCANKLGIKMTPYAISN